MSLVAHLRQNLFFACRLGQGVAFVDIMREGLLRKRRLPQVYRANGRRRMMMIRRGDQHNVELAVAFLKQLSVVKKGFWRRLILVLLAELFEFRRDGFVV